MAKEKLKTWSGAVMLPLESLVLCSWNCNVMHDREFAELCQEIKSGGFDEPCQVVPLKDENEGKYLVLGGEHRYKASIANNLKEIPCVIKKHLTDADEKELMFWSVKRNNIRGQIDEQKYAKLEQRLKENFGVAAEAARREMLIKAETLKSLRKSPVMEDNESLELSDDDDLTSDEVDLETSIPSGESSGNSDMPPRSNHPETDGERDTKKKFSDRRALLQALKAAEQEVLLESGDTVEHGYLFFGQSGGLHLVINENPELHELVSRMVAACKNNSESVIELLNSALKKEIPLWE